MVHVLPHRDFGRQKCKKPPKQYASPDGGSDPIASEPTNGPIRTQWICNPIWSGLTHGRGVPERYHRLPNEYVPLHAEYPEPLRRFKVLNMIFKSEFSVKNKAKEFRFFDYFHRCVLLREMLGSGGKPYCW